MDIGEFKEFGKAAVDYIANYYETLHERDVLPSVEPNYMQALVPPSIPPEPESWRDVLRDMDTVIMPGMTHWRSPHFHAYFPSGGSFPSIVGEMMIAALGVIGFSWTASPVCTELELLMSDWLARAMGLPDHFLNHPVGRDGGGGGVMQSSASESTLLALLVSKERAVARARATTHPDLTELQIKARLVCYTSEHANSSVVKAGMLVSVPMRQLRSDADGRMRGAALYDAVRRDIADGLIPCYVCATYGTTGTCAFDCVEELGPICEKYGIWLHVDAAYAGAALVCPELRHLMPGLELVDSLVVNLHKWLLVDFDCAAMWFKSRKDMENCFQIERIYLKSDHAGKSLDMRKFQIPLGKKFRALKVWFTLRVHGLSGVQAYIRRHIAQAEEFEDIVRTNTLYEIVVPKMLGIVGFRFKCDELQHANDLTLQLVDELMLRKRVYVIASSLEDKVFVRFVVCNTWLRRHHLEWAWLEIQAAMDSVLEKQRAIIDAASESRQQQQQVLVNIGANLKLTIINDERRSVGGARNKIKVTKSFEDYKQQRVPEECESGHRTSQC